MGIFKERSYQGRTFDFTKLGIGPKLYFDKGRMDSICFFNQILQFDHAGDAFSTAISHTINTVFETHTPLDAVGSCADIVWAHRILVSVVMSCHWDFHKMGIDMFRAFDTIQRHRILKVPHLIGCSDDDL